MRAMSSSVCGRGLRHLDQGAVGEHDIGRHALRLGQGAAFGLQRGQQRCVLVVDLGADDGRGAAGADQVTAQRDGHFAAQDRVGRFGDAQAAVAFGIGADQVVAQHLAQDRLPLGLGRVAPDAEGRQVVVAALA